MFRTAQQRLASKIGLAASAVCLGSVLTDGHLSPSCSSSSSTSTSTEEGASVHVASGGGTDKAIVSNAKEGPSLREELIGSYENRIRNFSAPERVFEYYASVEKAPNQFSMTPEDFVRAITPYKRVAGTEVGSKNFKYNFQAKRHEPTAEEKAKYLALLKEVLLDEAITHEECQRVVTARNDLHITPEAHLEILPQLNMTHAYFEELMEAKGGIPRSKFFSMVDMDGDGLISYEEFMLFRTLQAIPLHGLEMAFRMFDSDDSGAIEQHEFERFIEVMRNRTNAGAKEVSHIHDYANVGVYRLFFGEDGCGVLKLETFSAFVRLMKKEALRMQFHQWDEDGSGALSPLEFAQYLATTVNTDRNLEREFDARIKAKTDVLEGLYVANDPKNGVSVSLQEFMAYHEFLHYLDEMKVAMWVSGRELTLDQFLKAARAAVIGKHANKASIAGGGVNVNVVTEGEDDVVIPAVSENVARVLMAVFDQDGDGKLSQDEFIGLMQRQAEGQDPARNLGIVQFLSKVLHCAKMEVKLDLGL